MATEILEKSATAALDEVNRELSKIKSMVADAVDDGVRSALRAVRQGRGAAESALDDAIGDAKKAIKRNPLEAVGIVFAAAVVTGGLLALLTLRRR